MSIKCSHNVLEYSETRLSDRLIMLALADRADTDGYCWPSIKDIAKRTKCKYETVLRRIKEIEKTGELFINRRDGSTHQYFVLVGMTTDEVYSSLEKRAGLTHEEVTSWIIATSGVEVTPDEKSPLTIGWGERGIFVVTSGAEVRGGMTSHSDEPSLTIKYLNHQEPSLSVDFEKAKTAWQVVLGQLQTDMDKATYDNWVKSADCMTYEDGTFIIGTGNAYSRDWLESRLTSTVTGLLAGIMDRNVEVRFVVWQDK